jgi:hypothetical protein
MVGGMRIAFKAIKWNAGERSKHCEEIPIPKLPLSASYMSELQKLIEETDSSRSFFRFC